MRTHRTPMKTLAQIKTKAHIEPFTEMLMRCSPALEAYKKDCIASDELKEACELIENQFDELGIPTPIMEELLQCVYEVSCTVSIWNGEVDIRVSDSELWEAARLVTMHPKFEKRNPKPILEAFKHMLKFSMLTEVSDWQKRDVGMSRTDDEHMALVEG